MNCASPERSEWLPTTEASAVCIGRRLLEGDTTMQESPSSVPRSACCSSRHNARSFCAMRSPRLTISARSQPLAVLTSCSGVRTSPRRCSNPTIFRLTHFWFGARRLCQPTTLLAVIPLGPTVRTSTGCLPHTIVEIDRVVPSARTTGVPPDKHAPYSASSSSSTCVGARPFSSAPRTPNRTFHGPQSKNVATT